MTNQQKGEEYEKFIANMLNKDGIAYLWKDIPQRELIKSGVLTNLEVLRINRKNFMKNPAKYINPLRDIGFDVLQIKNGAYIFIQCKCGYEKGVGIVDLAGLFARLFFNPHLSGIVYYTHKLSQNLIDISKDTDKLEFIKLNPNVAIVKKPVVKFKLHDYQIDAIAKLVAYFKLNSKGIFSAPCGIGKTVISYNVSLTYKYVIIFAPFRQHAQQNLDRFSEYDTTGKVAHLLIDSDGTRSITEINKFIKENKSKRIIFSSTFKSVDVVNKFIGSLGNNYIVIVDEFHNLSKSNVGFSNKVVQHDEDSDNDDSDSDNESDANSDDSDNSDNSEESKEEIVDEMYKLITTSKKTLFMSATPRVYELEGKEDENTNEEIFGKVAYHMSYKEAVDNKYTCNYQIYFPSISEDKGKLVKDVQKEIDVRLIDDQIKARCMFILKGIQYNGNKKCIVFCKDKNDVKKFKVALLKLDEYYALGITVYSITSDDFYSKDKVTLGANSREWKLKQFRENKGISFMLSVRILDECIDIKESDSVFVAYPGKSKTRTIQRVNRCTRLDDSNPNKVAHVYIYCNEYDEILRTVSAIKEYDIDFKTKINVISTRLGSSEEMESGELEKDVVNLGKCIVGVKEYCTETWEDKLRKVDKYITDNKVRPNSESTDENEKGLGIWLTNQLANYKNKIGQLKNDKIVKIFENFLTKYSKIFESNEDNWKTKLNAIDEYITDNRTRPSRNSDNENIQRMGEWLDGQIYNYKNRKKYSVVTKS